VTVEAVLLPATVCRRVFGKEIGNNYATVELTISNRSDQASLIVHSIFIDYSAWALSGYSTSSTPAGASGPQPWQATTNSSQVASTEYRVARGQLLDAQPWTWRNVTIRALQAVGSIATAYTFTIGGQHAVRSIGAYNGQAVPAIGTFWPDPTVGQMNRISDVGFQVNKVISKNSSDIIVAFFPIDRFLTPGLRKLFLHNPAMFFAPYEMLVDPEARGAFKQLILPLFGNDESKVDAFMNDVSGDFVYQRPSWRIDFLDRVSLNKMRVIVAGVMTVDVGNVPASITSVQMDGENDNRSVWTELGEKTGSIRGSYLVGGAPTIVGADQLGITDVTPVPAGSTASELHFKLRVGKALNSGQKLTFKVVKKDSQSKDLESMPFDFVIPEFKIKINSVEMDGGNDSASVWTIPGEKTGKIKGSDLTDGTPVITGPDQTSVTDVAAVAAGSSDSELHFKMKLGKAVTPGQTLSFKITKKDKQDKTVESEEYELKIPEFTALKDIAILPPKISSVEMDGGNDSASVWTIPGEKTGKIKGSDLAGGTPVIVGPDQTAVTDVVAVATGSSDSELHFKMNLGKALTPGQTLSFEVVKKDKQNKNLESQPFKLKLPKFSVKKEKAQ
jgi:hypothetical protein